MVHKVLLGQRRALGEENTEQELVRHIYTCLRLLLHHYSDKWWNNLVFGFDTARANVCVAREQVLQNADFVKLVPLPDWFDCTLVSRMT